MSRARPEPRHPSRRSALLAALALALVLTACGSDGADPGGTSDDPEREVSAESEQPDPSEEADSHEDAPADADAAYGAEVFVVSAATGRRVTATVGDQTLAEDLLRSGISPTATVPAGEYDLAVVVTSDEADAVELNQSLVVESDDQSLAIVVHDAVGGDPTISVFDNDLSGLADGESRVFVRHVADHDPVDVWVGSRRVSEALAHGEQVVTDVEGDRQYVFALQDVGAEEAIGGPVATYITFGNRTAYVVFAAGKLDDGVGDSLIHTLRVRD